MRHFQKRTLVKQNGFTLVELLIAGTLGLLLITGVLQLFFHANKNFIMQDNLSTVQEDGRFALMFLEEQIQLGGWSVNHVLPKSIVIDRSTNGASDGNDSFTVSYQLDDNSLDCNGATVADGLIENTFYIKANGTDLMCLGNGGNDPQLLLSNVENFQILYGIESDVDCLDGIVNAYVNKSLLVANSKILSVKFALLIKSDGNISSSAKSDSFDVLDVTYDTPTDFLVRRLFQQTVYLPNAVYSTVGSPQSILNCMSSKI